MQNNTNSYFLLQRGNSGVICHQNNDIVTGITVNVTNVTRFFLHVGRQVIPRHAFHFISLNRQELFSQRSKN